MSQRTKTQKRNDKKRAAAKREGVAVPRGGGGAKGTISTLVKIADEITLYTRPLEFILGMLKMYLLWSKGRKIRSRL